MMNVSPIGQPVTGAPVFGRKPTTEEEARIKAHARQNDPEVAEGDRFVIAISNVKNGKLDFLRDSVRLAKELVKFHLFGGSDKLHALQLREYDSAEKARQSLQSHQDAWGIDGSPKERDGRILKFREKR